MLIFFSLYQKHLFTIFLFRTPWVPARVPIFWDQSLSTSLGTKGSRCGAQCLSGPTTQLESFSLTLQLVQELTLVEERQHPSDYSKDWKVVRLVAGLSSGSDPACRCFISL